MNSSDDDALPPAPGTALIGNRPGAPQVSVPAHAPPAQHPAGSLGIVGWTEASRGGTALFLAILGWILCFPVSLVAVMMASNEIKAVEAGTRSPQQIGYARAAFWVATVQLGFMAAIVLFMIVIAVFA